MDLGTTIAIVLLLAAAVGWILTGRVATYEEQLRQLSSGDPQGTNRLIEHEQRRTPGLSREAAAKRVVQALRRDSQ